MGIMDDMKGKADGLVDKAKEAAGGLKDKIPGGDRADGLIEKAKSMLDKDGDGGIDMLEKAKGAATGLVDKAKGLLHKDSNPSPQATPDHGDVDGGVASAPSSLQDEDLPGVASA